MSLSLDLAAAVQTLVGQTFLPSHTLTVSDTHGLSLSLDLICVETLGVSCEELRLNAPHLTGASMDLLKTWAGELCKHITYLLETLNPLEFDAQGNEVLIRSNPPDTSVGHPKYYEVILSSQGAGRFTLQRYEADPQASGRVRVPLRVTHEQLSKLVNDLVSTLPKP